MNHVRNRFVRIGCTVFYLLTQQCDEKQQTSETVIVKSTHKNINCPIRVISTKVGMNARLVLIGQAL